MVFYLFRQVEIGESYFKLSHLTLLGLKSETVYFNKIKKWKNGNPIFLYTDSGEYQIRWGTFSIAGCALIKQKIHTLNLLEIK
jgi:hypothetical protein